MSMIKGINQLKFELITAISFYKQTNENSYLRMTYKTLKEIEETYGIVGLKQLLFEVIEEYIK